MSVAGLKKQFHKATQVGRVQVRHRRPRRGTDRRRPPLRPLPGPIRSQRSAARQPGSVTRLSVSDRSSLRDSAPWPPHPCFLFPLRVPVVPSTLAPGPQLPSPGIIALCPPLSRLPDPGPQAVGPRTAALRLCTEGAAQVPGGAAGDYVKSPRCGDLAVRCAPLSWDVLAGAVFALARGCRGACSLRWL